MCHEVGPAVHDAFGTPFWEQEVIGGQQWYHSKKRSCIVQSIVNITLSLTIRPQFTVKCLSPTIKSTGGGSLWAKFGDEGAGQCKRNFDMIWERYGLLWGCGIQKKSCRYLVPLALQSTMHERDRQTDDQNGPVTLTSIAIGEIACQQRRLKICRVNSVWLGRF